MWFVTYAQLLFQFSYGEKGKEKKSNTPYLLIHSCLYNVWMTINQNFQVLRYLLWLGSAVAEPFLPLLSLLFSCTLLEDVVFSWLLMWVGLALHFAFACLFETISWFLKAAGRSPFNLFLFPITASLSEYKIYQLLRISSLRDKSIDWRIKHSQNHIQWVWCCVGWTQWSIIVKALRIIYNLFMLQIWLLHFIFKLLVISFFLCGLITECNLKLMST